MANHRFKYSVPIEITEKLGKDSLTITGTAVNETVSRNNVKYKAEELQKSADGLKGKPILDSHNQDSIKSILGTVRDSWYDAKEKSVKFKAEIFDKDVQEMINRGMVQHVSIGASAKDLTEESVDGETYKVAKGIEFLELSLVAVPGVPGATLNQDFTHAITESFNKTFKEEQMAENTDNRLEAIEKALSKLLESKAPAQETKVEPAADFQKLAERTKGLETENSKVREELMVQINALKESITSLKEKPKPKGSMPRITSIDEAQPGDFIVEGLGTGKMSFYEMPKERLRISSPGKYTVREA